MPLRTPHQHHQTLRPRPRHVLKHISLDFHSRSVRGPHPHLCQSPVERLPSPRRPESGQGELESHRVGVSQLAVDVEGHDVGAAGERGMPGLSC